MRLIDADKLKVYLQEYLHYGHAIPWVDAQPTAYDVEKVVAELEKAESVKNFGSRNSGNLLIPLKEAIDIVKRGGAE